MDSKQLFARNLKKERKKVGLSQVKLAEMLSYSAKAISKWESGSALPPTEVLPMLARALDTDLNSLFDFREDAAYFLGVDGGGTKTEFILTDAKGCTIRELTLGGCNPTSVGIENSANLLYKGIIQICDDIPLGKVSAFIGVAGCRIEANRQEISKRLEKLNLSVLSVGSDAQNIISAGLEGRDGVIVIMGTGSAIFASLSGKLHQIGGYGHFIGDTFSGSELGRACLEAVFSQLDKSGPETLLTQKVTEQKGRYIPQILSEMYRQGKSYMAELAHFVFEAAELGDAVANEIIERNVQKLALQLSAALSLFPGDKRFPVIIAGGITNYSDKFIERLKERITSENLEDIRLLPKEPVMGAVMLARRNNNA